MAEPFASPVEPVTLPEFTFQPAPTLSATICNWSSVAARPDTAFVTPGVQVLLVKPVTVPAAPSSLIEFVPPVVIALFTPSITAVPIVAFPAVIVLAFVPSVIVLDVALDVFTLPLPSSITLLSTVDLLDLVPSTNVFSSTVDVLVLVPSLIT